MRKLLFIILLVLPTIMNAQISGPAQTCLYQSYGYTDPNPGGTFTMTNARATISHDGSLMTVWSTGIDTVVYTYGNSHDSFVVSIFKYTSPIIVQRPEMCWIQTNNMRDSTLGTWSTSNTAVASFIGGTPHGLTATMRAVTSGTVTVIFTPDSNACNYAPVTANIQIDTFLSPITYTPDTNVCIGGVTVFSDYPAPGTWTVINPLVASVTSSGLVTGLAHGNTGIIYTLNNACSPEDAGPPVIRRDTQQVYVFQTAQPISGPAHVNINSSASYTDATPGGTWSLSVGSVNTIDASTGVLSTGPAQVTDTIYYTVTNTCGTSVAFTPFFIVVGNGMDSCHWLGIATPVPCPDYRAWKTTRDDQIDMTNNLLYQIWTNPSGGGDGPYTRVFDSAAYTELSAIFGQTRAIANSLVDPNSGDPVFLDAVNFSSVFVDYNGRKVFTDDDGNRYLGGPHNAYLQDLIDSIHTLNRYMSTQDSLSKVNGKPTLYAVSCLTTVNVTIPDSALVVAGFSNATNLPVYTLAAFGGGMLPIEKLAITAQNIVNPIINYPALWQTSHHVITPTFTGYIYYLK